MGDQEAHRLRLVRIPGALCGRPDRSASDRVGLLRQRRLAATADASPAPAVREVIAWLDLEPLAQRSILEMSYGQARKVLVARALVNAPRLLILDEVFDGLDQKCRAELADILEAASRDAGIILVAHHEDDCLPCITHRMVIAGGRIVAQEARVKPGAATPRMQLEEDKP
ncbi:MAG: ATP-binding cassette domain-containing protein [Chloroflexi bacterium]|nr:MAG: ATP-binding cassette domain-containing protein [Chloroflexota bacterium]